MDKIIALLTTSDGRIGRQQWWIGVGAMIVVAIVAGIVLSIISFGNATVFAWLAVLLNLALLYPSYNIGIKRRHDRDNDGMDLKILLGGSVLLNLLQASGIGVSWVDIGGGVMMPTPALWMSIINIIFGIFAIYMLVQLGFLKGTTGTNTFGADPVGAAA